MVTNGLTGSLKVNGVTSEQTLSIGSNVTLTAGAAGGSGSYTYKYVVKNLTNGVVFTMKDYSSSTTCTGTLTSLGEKEYTVYVKDATGNVVKSNVVKVNATNEPTVILKVNGTTSQINVSVGSNVVLTAEVTGESNNYLYKYVVKNLTNGVVYTMQDYSNNSLCIGTLTSKGIKEYTVYVIDNDGNIITSNTVVVIAL